MNNNKKYTAWQKTLMGGVLATVSMPAIWIGSSTKAYAQLEEVVVTARRRAENLQDTPISVSAISGDALEDAGITGIMDIKSVVPNVSITNGAKSASIFVRGIGQRQTNPENDPGVGQYLNGIYIPRQDALVMDAVDVANIQILRGPQGTLFGKNNTGGAMLIETKAPHYQGFDGTLGVTYGNYGRQNIKLGMNVPLADKMGVRLNFSDKQMDGYEKNIVDGRTYRDEDRRAVSARLTWDVSDKLLLDAFAFHSQQHERGLSATCELLNPNASVAFFAIHREDISLGQQCANEAPLVHEGKVGVTPEDSVYDVETTMLALTAKWQLSLFDVESITSWTGQDNIGFVDDVDYTSFSVIRTGAYSATRVLEADGQDTADERRSQITQELKFNGAFLEDTLDLTFGLFYAHEIIDDIPNAQVVGNNGLIGIPTEFLIPGTGSNLVLPFLSANANITNFDNTTLAGFVQGSWDFAENWQLTLGVRYTRDEKYRDIINYQPDFTSYGLARGLIHAQGGIYNPVTKAQFDAIDAINPPIPYNQVGSAKFEETFSQTTPLLTLTWFANDAVLDTLGLDSLMTYFTASQGYKGGGLALRGQRLSRFEPEVLNNTEIGFKFDGWQSRLRLNGAIYRMDYTDIQITQAEQGPNGPTDVIVFVTNAGEAVVQGAEFEATLALDALSINASMGYTDAQYREYLVSEIDGSLSDRSEEPFALVPEHNRSAMLSYEWFTPIGMVIPSLHYFYQSELYIGFDTAAFNYSGATLGQSEVFNGRITWVPSEDLRVALFVNNLKDTLDYGAGVALGDNLGVAGKNRTPPRMFGMEINWSWGI